MMHESVDFGLEDPAAVIEAFGQDKRARIERFYRDWELIKDELTTDLPSDDEMKTEEDRRRARDVVLKFLEALKAQNSEFLEICIDAYGRQVLADVHKATI